MTMRASCMHVHARATNLRYANMSLPRLTCHDPARWPGSGLVGGGALSRTSEGAKPSSSPATMGALRQCSELASPRRLNVA